MKIQPTGRRRGWHSVAVLGAGLMVLSGCDETGQFSSPFKSNPAATSTGAGQSTEANARSTVETVERDVEAPDVFQVTDMGLWDGRPSLGGVWIAHPDVKEPERVIIRNTENSNFVIGALFRRERANPGPIMQISSDAAEALGLLAGAPARLNVTALRREETPVEVPESAMSETPEIAETQELAPTGELSEPGVIEATPLDPVAGAAAAIEQAEVEAELAAASAPEPAPAPTPAPAAKPRASSLEKPYIQIGIFSVEKNAENTATAMRQAGMVPTVKKQTSQGKTFWRVIVGPTATKSERSVLLKKIKGVGFDDAYPVTN